MAETPAKPKPCTIIARTGSLSGLGYFCAICLLLGSAAVAQSKELTAEDIASRMQRGDAFGWEGSKTRLRMVLTDKNGKKKERLMEILGRRHKGKLQTVVRFLGPKDIAGTAFLMLERDDGVSEQYIYLSGLKRTRRIVGREREGSFMGSDFSYADMQRVESRHAHNIRLPDEKIGDTDTYVLESRLKKGAPSIYSKVTTWIRKTDYISLRTRFYDKAGKLLKTLYTRRVKQLDGKPVVFEARMQNNQTGHVTELIVESVERRDSMPDSYFTPTALEHW